jgi:hypothetical protein
VRVKKGLRAWGSRLSKVYDVMALAAGFAVVFLRHKRERATFESQQPPTTRADRRPRGDARVVRAEPEPH